MSKEQIIGKILQATPQELEKIVDVLNGKASPKAEAVAPADRRLLTFTEAGETLNLSRTTVQRMVDDGRLKAIETRSGRSRIASAEITRFLEGK